MTEQQRGLLLLLKSALTGEAYALPAGFDLAEAFAAAKRHGVTVMAYYGAHNCGIDTKSEPMQAAFMRLCRELAVGEQQTAELARLTDAFVREGIAHMCLKGMRMKALFPRPEMRRMGDADILIRTEQYAEKIRPLMLSLGYTEGDESDHELHWDKGTVKIELHKRLIPSYNQDYYAYFGDGWRLATQCAADGIAYSMKPEDELVYLFCHFAKHYRDAGIGLRHPMDIWVYLVHHPELDTAYLRAELEKLQLLTFYDHVVRTLNVWFADGEGDDRTEFITQYIMNSGEYGTREIRIMSDAMKELRKEKTVMKITIKKLVKTIFVPYMEMCELYPVLSSVPFLLPLFWGIYVVRRLFQKNRLNQYVKEYLQFDYSVGDDFHQALNFVGLDYHFGASEH